MAKGNVSAIDADELFDTQLQQLTAPEFIQALGRPELQRHSFTLIPDKKKYELWVDESFLPRLTLRELLHKVRFEKKKYELEPLLNVLEDPLRFNALEEEQYARLVESIAARVADRLQNVK